MRWFFLTVFACFLLKLAGCDTGDPDGNPDGCVPNCAGRVCGPNGCGGTCPPGCTAGATCNEATGRCGSCTPNCAGRQCGPDGCGGVCPPGCSGGTQCNSVTGQCQGTCVPACSGRVCGNDGCGGLCPPGCSGGLQCNDSTGQCQGSCVPACSGRVCGADGCGGTCGPGCASGQVCNIVNGQCETPCQPQCAGKLCGPDGCGDRCPNLCPVDLACNDATATCYSLEQDCSACAATGISLDNMRCAIELCDNAVFLGSEYTSPTNATTDGTYAAVGRFGDAANDLAPLKNGSYALMASGTATGTSHSVEMGGDLFGMSDPFAPSLFLRTHDVMEWRLHLKAPSGAGGFKIHYIFLSEEYDDFIGTPFNDKFYIFIEAASTNNGERTVINWTKCRNPDIYSDFTCDPATNAFCEPGEKYCYIAINTAFSECCWHRDCPDGTWTTDLAGTGYTCAASRETDNETFGSSTGWLVTQWVIQPGEEFDLIFHVHDTSDHIYDSEVILDYFLFVPNAEPGTEPM